MFNTQSLYVINPSSRVIGINQVSREFGIRILVTLKSGVEIDKSSGD